MTTSLLVADRDADGVLDELDNSPGTFNPDQRDRDLNGIGDASQSPSQEHASAAFLQAGLGGSTTVEARSLPVSEEATVLEKIVRIVDFDVRFGLANSASGLTDALVSSLVTLGIVRPEDAAALINDVLSQVATPVVIDIEPNDDRNRIDLHGGGDLRIAVLGTSDFDVRDIDIRDLSKFHFGDPLLSGFVTPCRAKLESRNGGRRTDLELRFDLAQNRVDSRAG